MERIVELVSHKTLYPEICMQLQFIKENCGRLMQVITILEGRKEPLAPTVYNLLEDLLSYVRAGTERECFGSETDRWLARFPQSEKKKYIKSFKNVFMLAKKKLCEHLDNHQAYQMYKATRIFDPRQLHSVSHDIGDYTAITALSNPSTELNEEWLIYTQWKDTLPTPFCIPKFGSTNKDRFPTLASIASNIIWMPVTSVEVERSFSSYKHILNDRCESLTDENTKRLLMLYFNGDVEQRFQ